MTNILEVQDLKKYFPIQGGILRRQVGDVRAVDGVSLKIEEKETFGLVGESGCGKTTFGKTVIRILEPTSGHIYFHAPNHRGKEQNYADDGSHGYDKTYDLSTLQGRDLRWLRRRMQIVYQDPSTSLDPRMLVKDIVGEPLVVQGLAHGVELRERVVEILERVGLKEGHLYRYPYEFSGGQRQRIAIARTFISNPDFVVLDEPTSAVDVSVRAQLLDLFLELQRTLHLTYLFISHDLSVIESISNRVGVMYLGKVVEVASAKELFHRPLHPYTQALISSIPVRDPKRKAEKIILKGEVPSPINPPPACRFNPRCPYATDLCRTVEPKLEDDVVRDHFVACHYADKLFHVQEISK